ncbi:HAD family hydrolase [Acidianus manzaensis]|uniref:2-haloalkanoic acid dehalogenase n=1 Tax=Acidianus manzaensis TaxID=282676 RepID=A0A1W6K2E1_9CREN|nr:HAD family hydrolase [Acidianus manzaensis]ARM76713.1 2-haloalkanoic acid dehalogenase [Acidianus manzaensis]
MPSIFVDFGYTLVGFKPSFYEKVYDIIKDYNNNVSLDKVFRAYVKAMSKNNFPDEEGRDVVDLKDFLYHLGITPREKLLKELDKARIRDGEPFLYDDTIDFLESYKSLGYKIILVSNASKGIYKLIDKFELMKYFDGLVLSFEVKLVKPHPKIFFKALEKSKEYPDFHLGDIYEIDYIGAKRAGIQGMLIDRQNFYPDIRENKVKSLKELIREENKINSLEI